MPTDLETAKAKLKENRESGPGARKHEITKRDQDAIMAENRRRGGSDVGEKRQTPKARDALARRLKEAQTDAQSTDSNQ